MIKANTLTSNYTLELPQALAKRRIHPNFYFLLLKPFVPNNDLMFLNRATPEPYNFGVANNTKWFVEEIIGHKWTGKKLEVQVCWSLGNTTWELYGDKIKALEALDNYLELFGVE